MRLLSFILAGVEPVTADAAPVWTWRETLAVVAISVSFGALVISWLGYRQRVRYHPQPLMMLEWEKKLVPSSGLFFREAYLWNRGEAPARKVEIEVSGALTTPWQTEETIEPGASLHIRVPVVDGVRWTYSGFMNYERTGTRESYRFITPVVKARWLQVPLDAKPKVKKWTAPKTPDALNGETT